MTVRIDVGEGFGGSVVRVAGRLGPEAVGELLALCRLQKGAFVLDLEDLVGVDQAGIVALNELCAAGARVIGASRYIRMLLTGGRDVAAPAVSSASDSIEEDE